MARTETCAALGCDARIPEHKLMCRPHWFEVPKASRNRFTGLARELTSFFDKQGKVAEDDELAAIAAHRELKRHIDAIVAGVG